MTFRCSSPERSRPALTNKSIVLDLDSTLICTFDDAEYVNTLNIMKDPRMLPVRQRLYRFHLYDAGEPMRPARRGEGEVMEVAGVFRPHAVEFLKFCFDYFANVCVWSAGQEGYVNAITDRLFQDFQDPSSIYTWEHCNHVWLHHNEGQMLSAEKPLVKLYEIKPTMNETNTFLLDDNKNYFKNVNLSSAIHIPAYLPEMTPRGLLADDVRLYQVMDWLERPEVMNATDVRQLDKSRETVFGMGEEDSE